MTVKDYAVSGQTGVPGEFGSDLSSAETECLFRSAASITTGCIVDVGAASGSTVPLCAGAAHREGQLVYSIGSADATDGPTPHADRTTLLQGLVSAGLLGRARLLDLPSEHLVRGWQAEIGLLVIGGADQTATLGLWRPFLAQGAIVILRHQSREGWTSIIEKIAKRDNVTLLERVGSIEVLKLEGATATNSVFDRGEKYPRFDIRPVILARTAYYGNNGAYLYQPITKCGCTTIKTILIEFEGLPPIENEWRRHQKKFNKFPGVEHLSQLERRRVFHDETDTFKFVFVRNPFSRLLSAYKDKMRGGMRYALKGIGDSAKKYGVKIKHKNIGFADFVHVVAHQDFKEMDAHWRPQTVVGRLQYIKYNYIGRFENMEADLNHALRRIGVPDHLVSKASHKQNATNSSMAEWDGVSADIRKAFLRKFEMDFDLLQYPTQI